MKSSFLLFVWLSLFLKKCLGERGYVLTSPKLIDSDSVEYFTFTAFDSPRALDTQLNGTLKLIDSYYGTYEVLAQSNFVVKPNSSVMVEMKIPPLPDSVLKADLRVQADLSPGRRAFNTKEVRIRHSSFFTFIQTDKPMYKPGQTVKFRILPMDNQLRPLKSNGGDVWIEDPSGIRVAQWRKVQFEDGMVQLELPLSDEPPLGVWSINAMIKNISTKQKFDVQKYVLPKFEVTIETLPIITTAIDVIPVKICAKYTFGKKVVGRVKTKVTYKKMISEFVLDSKSLEHNDLISGCCNITVTASDLQIKAKQDAELEFFAEVIENGTEIVINETITKKLIKPVVTIEFLGVGDSEYFRHGIPYFGQAQVKNIDGKPAVSEKISLCVYDRYVVIDARWDYYGQPEGKNCKIFTTNRKGQFQFSIAPQSTECSKMVLVAEGEVKYVYLPDESGALLKNVLIARSKLTLYPWYSRSHSHIQIPSTNEMECDKMQRVRVRYSGTMIGTSIKFYSQVMSRGKILHYAVLRKTLQNSVKLENSTKYDFEEFAYTSLRDSSLPPELPNLEKGEFDFKFLPSSEMSPIIRILVYYIRRDGEVVADSREFRVTKCFPNKVNLRFQREQQYPNTEASLTVAASPSSVCGIGLVDKSVLLLKPETQLIMENIFAIMKGLDVNKYHSPRQVTDNYCPDDDMERPFMFRSSRRHRYKRYSELENRADTSMAFEAAGLVVISDFKIETRPCKEKPRRIDYDIEYRGYDFGWPGGHGDVRGFPGPPVALFPVWHTTESHRPPTTEMPLSEVYETPSVEEIRNYFPETWLWEMQTVNASGEATFMRRLPHTITQWRGRAVCVHPEIGLGISEDASITAFQPFFIDFRLPYSVVRGETLVLTVTVYNFLTQCLPITITVDPSDEFEIQSESKSRTVCVCGDERISHKFLIKPTRLGTVNITVYGYSLNRNSNNNSSSNEVCSNEIIAEIDARDAISKQLKAEGIPKEDVVNYFICPKNTNGAFETTLDLMPEVDVIKDSLRVYASISADLMAPALNSLQGLVELPMGCGEQNMVLFTPNIFVLDYLTATGRKTKDIEDECLKNMKIGYQRELTYRHEDGSYSCFGKKWDAEGSLWLTSFVIKSFCQATRFVDIDEQDIQTSVNWVLRNQLENGCFRAIGTLHNKEMKGGLEASGQHSLAPLTAYVLISMIESGKVRVDQEEVQNAIKCLKSDGNPNTYALSLYAYALALAKRNTTALMYLKTLDDKSVLEGSSWRSDGLKYWSVEDVEGGEGRTSKSVSVEIAGYYILARLELEKAESMESVLPVVRWISKQRNSNGGFISTQDTVIALQALARYATVYQQGMIRLNITMETESFVKEFELNEDNKLVTQEVKLPEDSSAAELVVTGEGCTLVQLTHRYNVREEVGSDAFELDVDVDRVGGHKCNSLKIGICMRYIIENETSNMVVMYAKMASGYIPVEESLQSLHSKESVSLKRYEIEENVINLYFDQLTNEKSCFVIYAKNELEVENIQPKTVTIQDYYTPELQVTKEYSVPPVKPPLPVNPQDQHATLDVNRDSINDINKLTSIDVENECIY